MSDRLQSETKPTVHRHDDNCSPFCELNFKTVTKQELLERNQRAAELFKSEVLTNALEDYRAAIKKTLIGRWEETTLKEIDQLLTNISRWLEEENNG